MTMPFDNKPGNQFDTSAEVSTEYVPMASAEVRIETPDLTVIVKAPGSSLNEMAATAERLFAHGRSKAPHTQPVGFSAPGAAS